MNDNRVVAFAAGAIFGAVLVLMALVFVWNSDGAVVGSLAAALDRERAAHERTIQSANSAIEQQAATIKKLQESRPDGNDEVSE